MISDSRKAAVEAELILLRLAFLSGKERFWTAMALMAAVSNALLS